MASPALRRPRPPDRANLRDWAEVAYAARPRCPRALGRALRRLLAPVSRQPGPDTTGGNA